ncbi:MAG: hypothetical protein IJP27_03520 [Clostridia bacterium]|nr:hypothetical protein [Clostridia bacterium]
MKKVLKTVTMLCVIVLLLTSNTFSSLAKTDVISSDQAVDLALFYYFLSAPEETVSIDSYSITPLYDKEMSITYYCVDFFYQGTSKGYVVVGSSLKNILCAEMSYEGTSKYLSDSENDICTIYYNPFEIFYLDEDTQAYYDQNDNEIMKSDIDGLMYSGDMQENQEIMQLASVTSFPEDSRTYINQDPYYYLQELGFTNVQCDHYGTRQSVMTAAGAFNKMYTIQIRNGRHAVKTLSSTDFSFSNPGHCAITAISNILLYWRYMVMPNIPASYEQVFTDVFTSAINSGYIRRYASYNSEGELIDDGLNFEQARDVMMDMVHQYGYDGTILYCEEADWDFLTEQIDSNKVVYLRFEENNPRVPELEFDYSNHATIAYGYTVMNANTDTDAYIYQFVKVHDGWRDDPVAYPRYVCWEMLTQSTLDVELVNGVIIEHSIDVGMFSFYPHQ